MKPVVFLAPNQCYFFSGNKIIFQSYNTIICTVINHYNGKCDILITDNQPQSVTTAKWLNKFLKLHVGIDNYKNINK